MSMLIGKCYCGSIQIEIPRKPSSLTDCNCSVCRKYGALWAYYLKHTIKIKASKKSLFIYTLGNGGPLRICHCKKCGCVTHYDWGKAQRSDKMMAVNARIFDLELLESIPVRKLDGARNWKSIKTAPTYPFKGDSR